MTASVVCFGDNCMDLYDAPIKRKFVGGNAVNTAVHCKKSGCNTSYVGSVGNDENGKLIIQKLNENGIDTKMVQQFNSETAWTKVSLTNGERVFEEEYLGPVDQYELTEEVLEYLFSHGVIHNTWQGGTEKWLKTFKNSQRVLVSLDYGERYPKEFLDNTIEYIDLAFFSISPDEYSIAKEYAKRIHQMGPRYVVITAGSYGAFFSEKDGEFIFYPAEKINVVDTLGAGDTFIGTFLGCFVSGKSYHECLQMATQAAAENCQLFGGFQNSEVL